MQNMINPQTKRVFGLILLISLFLSSASVQTNVAQKRPQLSNLILHDEIIQEGFHAVGIEQKDSQDNYFFLSNLEQWYDSQSLVEFASLVGTSITVKFIDGSYTVIMDPFQRKNENSIDTTSLFLHERYGIVEDKSAVLLNTAEYMYGHRQCKNIITTLLRDEYSIEYLANEAVDLAYLKHNLSADVIYMNTHAGYFDVDGDHQADAVVIATGEFWTNETEQKYAFDYQNKLIVKGMVGNQGFVAFTPAFIDYYYSSVGFPNSLVFMATCYASYDTSRAQKFLDAGAGAYMGWSQNTVFWTNSKTSVNAFRLLSCGLTVQQVCRLIRSGGFYNWLFHSKLIFYGDGDHRIP
jgi:hypothetical protein